jgi:hypothetical protein
MRQEDASLIAFTIPLIQGWRIEEDEDDHQDDLFHFLRLESRALDSLPLDSLPRVSLDSWLWFPPSFVTSLETALHFRIQRILLALFSLKENTVRDDTHQTWFLSWQDCKCCCEAKRTFNSWGTLLRQERERERERETEINLRLFHHWIRCLVFLLSCFLLLSLHH